MTEEAMKVTAAVLGYKTVDDMFDYRNTGKQDRERDRIATVIATAMAADKARIAELEGVLNNLAMAAGELNVATDGQDAILSQRSAVLEALFDTRATLTSEADNADG